MLKTSADRVLGHAGSSGCRGSPGTGRDGRLDLGRAVHWRELRHELPISIPDAFTYARARGESATSRRGRFRGAAGQGGAIGGYVFHPFDEFGFDELRRAGLSRTDLIDEVVVRAARPGSGLPRRSSQRRSRCSPPIGCGRPASRSGSTRLSSTTVGRSSHRPSSRGSGERRRRRPPGWGWRADLLRRAVPGAGGVLKVDGLPLTSEAVKAAIAAVFVAHGAAADEFIVSHGAQAAVGHEMGSGELRAGEPIVDRSVAARRRLRLCFADMTRTFVVGPVPDEVARWHEHCLEALERSRAALGVGVRGVELFDLVCDLFEAAGYATERAKAEGEMLDHGFFHSLRPRRRPCCPRGAVPRHLRAAADRRRRRRHARARPLPAWGRRRPARRSRPRHRRRRRDAHRLPDRPGALTARRVLAEQCGHRCEPSSAIVQ